MDFNRFRAWLDGREKDSEKDQAAQKGIVGGSRELQIQGPFFAERNRALIESGLIDYEGQSVKVVDFMDDFEDGQWAGVAGIILRYRFLPTFFLAVNQKMRNKGMGTRLTQKILSRKKGPLFLTVWLDNAPAIKIYAKTGFFSLAPWRKIRGRPTRLMMHW